MKIANDFLIVTFKNEAAEFTSLIDKKTKTEFAWQGNPDVWAGRNPTLFPVVGKVWQEKYRLNGQEFSLGNHGFARKSEFSLAAQTPTSLTLVLENSPATQAVYPFKFRLSNHYQLEKNTLKVTLTVENLDQVELPFSLGAHPAFNCPLLPEEKFTDYKIVFSQPENLTRLLMNSDSSFQEERLNFGQQVKEIPLTRELFAQDALVFENLQSTAIKLQGPHHSVTVSNPDCPWFSIWTKGDFLCLEPWQGHGDFANYQGDFRQREGTLFLAPRKKFVFTYNITID